MRVSTGSRNTLMGAPLVFDPPLTIGVIADTHVFAHGTRRLGDEIPDLFARLAVGLILHAGDVNTASVLRTLDGIAPTLAVRGNNEEPELHDTLPAVRDFRVGRHTFMLLHGDGDRTARTAARRYAGRVDCVVYGHSHIPRIDQVDDTILFNPGSATDRRWQPHFGVGVIRVTTACIDPELVLFDDPRQLANVS
jgi:putative phosphoesterase